MGIVESRKAEDRLLKNPDAVRFPQSNVQQGFEYRKRYFSRRFRVLEIRIHGTPNYNFECRCKAKEVLIFFGLNTLSGFLKRAMGQLALIPSHSRMPPYILLGLFARARRNGSTGPVRRVSFRRGLWKILDGTVRCWRHL